MKVSICGKSVELRKQTERLLVRGHLSATPARMSFDRIGQSILDPLQTAGEGLFDISPASRHRAESH